MKRIISRFLCLAVAAMLLMMPAKALASEQTELSDASTSNVIVIEDEETPLYAGISGHIPYGVYLSVVAAGAFLVFGTVIFIQKKKSDSMTQDSIR